MFTRCVSLFSQLFSLLFTQNTLYCPSPDVFSFAVFSLNYISKWTSLCDKASSLFHMLPLAMFWNSTHLFRVKGCRQHKKQWKFSNKIIFVSNYVCLWKFKFIFFILHNISWPPWKILWVIISLLACNYALSHQKDSVIPHTNNCWKIGKFGFQ